MCFGGRAVAGSKEKSRSLGASVCGVAILALALGAGCTGNTSSTQNSGANPSGAGVVVSPATANVRAEDSQQFSAAVNGAPGQNLVWSVNGVVGGTPSTGTIDAGGKYTAPAALPNSSTIAIQATSAADASMSGSAAVMLWNPTPVATGISPSSVNTGNITLTVNGSKFVNGAQVFLGSTALQTAFNSSTQLTATGNASTAGAIPVTVRNPDPGASSSVGMTLQVGASAQAASCSGMALGAGASLHGFRAFPDNSSWNKDISAAPVDLNSSGIINFIGGTVGLHADFGSGQYNGSYMGIPYLIVGPQQPMVDVNYMAYGDESDPGPMPIPVNANIEGYPNPGTGDRHVLVLDSANCFLYELYSSYPQTSSWNADSGAVWDLLATEQRPYQWTSADAAGLPVFPGLIRYDEVASGQIRHAIRFTLARSRAAFTPPASHWAANSTDPNAPPMGMRLRLRANFDVSGYSPTNQVILNAMKMYGLILADNGSSMYISGAPDDRWDNNDLHQLGNVHASDFEVVQMSPVYTAGNLPAGVSPQIGNFSASATTVSAGTSVTLSWQATGASYVIVSPEVGAVRGTSVTVKPSKTTTYTLYATNAFGRATASVTVTVQ